MYNSAKLRITNLLTGCVMKKGLFVLLLAAMAPSVYGQNAQAPAAAQSSRKADAYFHFSLARLLDAQMRYTEAVDEYKKALDLDPKNSNLYSEMAQTYFRGGRDDSAKTAANEAVKINPDNIDAHTLLSQTYWKALIRNNAQPTQELINQASHELEEIIRIDPADPQAFLQLGQLYEVTNQPAKAEEIYRKHLNVDPNSEEGVIALAGLHVKTQDFKGAVKILEDFLKIRPESDRAAKELGDAYISMEQYGIAADSYKLAISLGSDDPDIDANYAQALFNDHRYDEATAVFERMLQENPNDGATLLRLSQIYRRTGKYDKARAALEAADKMAPGIPEVQFNLFLVDREEGKLEEGLARLERLIKSTEHPNGRYSQSEQQNRIVFLTNLAILNSSLGHYDQAVVAYQSMRPLSQDKDRVDALIVESYRANKSLEMA